MLLLLLGLDGMAMTTGSGATGATDFLCSAPMAAGRSFQPPWFLVTAGSNGLALAVGGGGRGRACGACNWLGIKVEVDALVGAEV